MKTRTRTASTETEKRERTDGLIVQAQPLWRVEVHQPDGSDLTESEAVAVAKDYAPGRAPWHVAAIERQNYDHVVVTLCR